MKQFFKMMFASMLAMLVTFFIAMIIFVAVIGALISSATSSTEKVVDVKENSVLHLKFDYEIKDRTSNNPFENINFSTFEAEENLGLDLILTSLEKAKTDDRIKGIYLDLTSMRTGMASLEEIRNALKDFKKSGKWIISYSEVYTQSTYYLASLSDKIYVNPAGLVEMRGLATQLMFFKNALEKLDVEMQIIRHGKFKSAVEPFMLDKMSDSNREQMNLILSTAWGSMLKDISESRKISIEELNAIADDIKIQTADDAVKYGFVDKKMFKDEVLEELKAKTGAADYDDINYLSLRKYSNAKAKANKSKNEIAIIYASGEINSGKSQNETMGSETISEAIREARLDNNVKAIVLRVNSPGGSALASDVMWREVVLAKKVKPVVVSMGDVAASGGYYIACAADKIVADEKTITGSIGVFGVIPNAQGLFNNKLGITFDVAKTNKHGDIMTVFRPLTADEKDIIQIGVEKIYDDFITKVGEGRGMSKEQVDSIGQGRVWTGLDAKKIGLVDEIGGIDKAIAIAKKMAKIDDYKTVAYPKLKDPLEQFMISLTEGAEAKILKTYMGENYKYYQKVQTIGTQSGYMTRMPYEIDFH
ncbi:MAG: signal peptide peptidase SppA [Flavobacteriales bacterium]